MAREDGAVHERKINIPMVTRAAETRPSSYREEDNSLEVVWSTGARRAMFDWLEWDIVDEELSLEAGAVRLDRLNAGAAVLDTHDSWQLRSVIGSVEPGSARIDGAQAVARVRLSDTEDCKDIVAKIRAGHIRNISVGYIVHAVTRFHEDGKRTLLRVDDWEPTEISFVPVPADSGAQVRSQNAEQGGFPCIVRGLPAASKEEKDMSSVKDNPAGETVERNEQPEVNAVPAAVTAKRIRDVVSRSDLGAEFALELVARNEDAPLTEAGLTDAITEKLAEKRNSKPIDQRSEVVGPVASGEEFRSSLESGLLSRNKRPSELTEDERMFRGMGLRELSRFYLEAQGKRTLGMRPDAMFVEACRFGAHGTSDFGTALQNVAQKSLLEGYNASEQTFWPFTRRATLKDFKPSSLVALAALSPFLLVEENAEFKRLVAEDFGDTVQLATYGGIFALTRQAIINDDAGIFTDIPSEMGRLAADHESDTIYGILTSNPAMYDGTALFHADHGNLAASGSAISVASVGAGRAAMAAQTTEGGRKISGLYPKYLVTGPAKQTEAEQLVAAVTAAQTDKVNPFAGKLMAVTDPRITDNSWYLAAEARHSGLVAGYLEGQEEVFLDTREGFDVDGTEWKGRLDYVGKAVDWRGLYKNPGA